MNPDVAALHIDLDELAQGQARNRRQRMDWVAFKARWVREHCIQDTEGSDPGEA